MRRAHATATPSPLRIELRGAAADRLEAVRPWFGMAWRDVRGLSTGATMETPSPAEWLAALEPGRRALLIELDAQPVGFLTYQLDGVQCTIGELAVRPELRNLGYGSEAVLALERQAAAAGARSSVALVPILNGLAIYFWLRIGYRPRYPAPERIPGLTLMVRELVAQAAPGSGSRRGARRSGAPAQSPVPVRQRSR
ncbi:MAG TPA: GNAT family N-acetyltransferase [Dehalococcoidia bacterium]|jgi:GNAT superfamily N-acetyltransferase